jgi:hypothetical protein
MRVRAAHARIARARARTRTRVRACLISDGIGPLDELQSVGRVVLDLRVGAGEGVRGRRSQGAVHARTYLARRLVSQSEYCSAPAGRVGLTQTTAACCLLRRGKVR